MWGGMIVERGGVKDRVGVREGRRMRKGKGWGRMGRGGGNGWTDGKEGEGWWGGGWGRREDGKW